MGRVPAADPRSLPSGAPEHGRSRILRAYAVTLRVLASYAWLRLWRPILPSEVYERKLVERHRANARRVERAILSLGGLFIKVGQLISILANFLPEAFRAELEGLQDAVPARPLEQIIGRLDMEFGRGPQRLFKEWNPDPIASASLAQVHEAILHDGRRVAVKVQHADIERTVRLDLRAIRRILFLVQLLTRVRGLGSYHAEISAMIHEELDFEQEAGHIAEIAAHFAGNPMVGFPVVVPELSTSRVLTTELVRGTKITDLVALDAQGIDRAALAQRVLTAYCQMMFVDGVYHADPHPGNIIVRPDGGIVFIDFGAVGDLSPAMKAGIPQLLDGVVKRDAPRIARALTSMGFVARDERRGVPEVAERVIDYFQRRFLEQVNLDSFSLRDVQVDLKAKAEAIADLRALDVGFRELTRTFQVPKDWVLLERTLLLLLGLCTTLAPGMNPMRTIQPYLETFVLGAERDWVALVRGAVKDMALTALALPDGVSRLVSRANRGDLEVKVEGLRESAALLYAAAQQFLFGALASAAGIVAYLARERGDGGMMKFAGSVSALFLVMLALSAISARKLRR